MYPPQEWGPESQENNWICRWRLQLWGNKLVSIWEGNFSFWDLRGETNLRWVTTENFHIINTRDWVAKGKKSLGKGVESTLHLSFSPEGYCEIRPAVATCPKSLSSQLLISIRGIFCLTCKALQPYCLSNPLKTFLKTLLKTFSECICNCR